MIQEQFDVGRIIGVKIVGRSLTSYTWMPAKQKTTFFGLIKRNKWWSEGFYQCGCYQECYESGCWDACSYTAEELRRDGYIVESGKVYSKPYVTVYLESEYQSTKRFNTEEEAKQWVDELKATSGKTFEIIER
jgi:hypothetical protein